MDVVVLGGGIVGLTMCNLLAKHANCKVTLLEPKPPLLVWNESEYDIRCSAITRAAQNIFSYLGVWDEIISYRVGMYDQMLVWDQNPSSKLHFRAHTFGETDLGHIIENRVIAAALYKKLLQQTNVSIIQAAADRIEQHADLNRIISGTHILDCKLIIGADGINSWLRNIANIASYGWDYQHKALVATIKTQLPHNNTARQRFMPDGPLAFLPLKDSNLCSIVWSSNPARIEYLMQLDPQEFCMQLAAEFSYTLGTLELLGERASFPLRMLHASKYVTSRIALIGDAAHVIHPLAGQGLNLGIMDAAILDEVLQAALLRSEDIGALQVLRKYERRRKGHNLSMITLVEALKRLFASKHGAIVNLRLHGMRVLNSLDVGKNSIMHFAMGLGGDLPLAARNG